MISIIYEIPILCMISVFLSTLLICMAELYLLNEGMIGLLGLMLPSFYNYYYYGLLIIDEIIYVLIQLFSLLLLSVCMLTILKSIN